jgi:hypothetical protein
VDGGDESWPTSSASLQVLFFAAPVFMLLSRDDFLLQVTGVFTRIVAFAWGLLLTVYFGTPNMFITILFGFDYGTNPPLGTLII